MHVTAAILNFKIKTIISQKIFVRPKDVFYCKKTGTVRREITGLDCKHQLNPSPLNL